MPERDDLPRCCLVGVRVIGPAACVTAVTDAIREALNAPTVVPPGIQVADEPRTYPNRKDGGVRYYLNVLVPAGRSWGGTA